MPFCLFGRLFLAGENCIAVMLVAVYRCLCITRWNLYRNKYTAAADPGFPIGRALTHGGGVPTSDVGTFQLKLLRKQKNWVPLDPPLHC